MHRTICFLVLCSLVLLSTANAFDGQRRGFAVGGGLGFSPMSRWASDPAVMDLGVAYDDETGGGFAWQFSIGTAWDDRNLIAFEWNGTSYGSDVWDVTMNQEFLGVAWTYYLRPTQRSFFTKAGVGVCKLSGEPFLNLFGNIDDLDTDPGIGLMLGGGYQFSRYFQIGLNATYGATGNSTYDFSNFNTSVIFSAYIF